jgi:hypothetical protein
MIVFSLSSFIPAADEKNLLFLPFRVFSFFFRTVYYIFLVESKLLLVIFTGMPVLL